jgi:hypothetical protein
MNMHSRVAATSLALSLGLAAFPLRAASPPIKPTAAALEHFEKKVRPLLVDNCYTCHSANTNSKGGLRVDDRNGLITGGNNGAAIVPGDPEASLLIQSIRQNDDLKMPPKKKLTDEQISILSQWIKDGAAWPEATNHVTIPKSNPKYDKLLKEHWAWQPLKATATPSVKDKGWAKGEIDNFVLAQLEKAHLKPVADADRTDLIRRVTFDLTGLPPTPDAIDSFVNDKSPKALEAVVDRLLASPAFGERWGRHWLDVARFGESTGASRNLPFPHAWRYRDYVIDAINTDKPYDQFIREQIAGDLLPAKDQTERDKLNVATGFLAVGVKDVNQRFKVRFIMDNVDEQIDTVSRGILGTTVSCARCHDHKFDPIPTADYYALAGIFRSTDLCAGLRNKMGGGGLDYYDNQMLITLGNSAKPTPDSLAKVEKLKKDVEQARKDFQALVNNPKGNEKTEAGLPKRFVARQKMNKLQLELLALTDPAATGKVAMGVRDAKQVADTEIRLRGEAEKLGPVVPRGFLTLVKVPDAPKLNTKQSGRLELAQWLTSPSNPLISRVIVNRVWQHLFDEGIVRSVDNFGITGDKPSHPELLDHLATEFVRDNWSIKRLVRKIVLTRAYGLAASASPEAVAVDPANRLVWRHSPRRLSSEEIRDAILASSGKLDNVRIEASPAKELKVIELPNNGPLARKLVDQANSSLKRSVYLPLLRDIVPPALAVFDPAEQGMVTGSRATTTVAPQALYLLNDPFVRKQSLTLAERLNERSDLDIKTRVTQAYRLILGRTPNDAELGRVQAYLVDFEAAYPSEAAQWAAAKTKQETLVAKVDPPKATTGAVGNGNAARPAQPVNPDEIIQVEAPVKEELIEPKSPRVAAFSSFVQALYGSAEFRFLK